MRRKNGRKMKEKASLETRTKWDGKGADTVEEQRWRR